MYRIKNVASPAQKSQSGQRGPSLGKKSLIESASEVAPRIGVHRNTHHRHSQRGRGGTRILFDFCRCAPNYLSFGFPRPREEKRPKQGVQDKGCSDAPELGSAVQRSALRSTASTEAEGVCRELEMTASAQCLLGVHSPETERHCSIKRTRFARLVLQVFVADPNKHEICSY